MGLFIILACMAASIYFGGRIIEAQGKKPNRNHRILSALPGLVVGIVAASATAFLLRTPPAPAANQPPAQQQAAPTASREALVTEMRMSRNSDGARQNYADQIVRNWPGTPEAEEAAKLSAELKEKAAIDAIGAQWVYSKSEDGMTGKMSSGAMVQSANTFEFDFPYQGAQHATLTLRKHPRHGKDVILAIEKGQIQCSSYDCLVRVRFDDESPKTYTGNEPADNSSEYVFIPAYGTFSTKLKTAKRVRIEVNVFHQGALMAEFDVSGFKPEKL